MIHIAGHGARRHYRVLWDTHRDDLDQDAIYRVRVKIGALEIGYADVDLDRPRHEQSVVADDEFVGLGDRRVLPVRFVVTDDLAGAAVLGPRGGVVRASGLPLAASIPEGAIQNETLITIAVTEAQDPPLSIRGSGTGITVQLGPSGLKLNRNARFSAPVVALVPFLVDDLNELRIEHWNDEDGFFEVVTTSVDSELGTISFEIGSFSFLNLSGGGWLDGWNTFDARWTIPVVNWTFSSLRDVPRVSASDVRKALRKWDVVTGRITFNEVTDDVDAQVLVVEGVDLDGFVCPGQRLDPAGPTTMGFACPDVTAFTGDDILDESNSVVVYIDTDAILNRVPADQFLDAIDAVITHELGHAIGIAHTSREPFDSTRPVMAYPTLTSELHPWDIEAAQFHYGPPGQSGTILFGRRRERGGVELRADASVILLPDGVGPVDIDPKIHPDGSLRPTWAADGRSLALLSYDERRSLQLYVMDVGSDLTVSNVRQLAPDQSRPLFFRALEWSPDGAQILFEGFEGLFVTATDGSGAPRLVVPRPDDTGFFGAAWSPSGTEIAYTTRGETRGLFLVSAAGGTASPLIVLGSRFDRIGDPDWSDVTDQLAFQMSSDIYVMDADGSGLTNLTDSDDLEEYAVWSPDGSRVLFGRLDPDTQGIDLMTVRVGGGEEPEMLIPDQLPALGLDWVGRTFSR